MASFVPAQFSSFTSNFNFESLRTADNISTIRSKLNKLKSAQDFFDIKRFSKPSSIYELQNRVTFNLGYFNSNYLAIFLLLSTYTLFTNLWLLFDLVFIILGAIGISKLNGEDLDLRFIRFTSSQLYTLLLCIGLPILFISSPISTIIWLISSSAFVIFGHAALIDKPIEDAFNVTV